ncbi:MAG: hypothetical protein QOK29_2140, partial [Rhodospirillaceae bacterium]|nr:hypothetical protein [Rhodospirillaceae bacterium]
VPTKVATFPITLDVRQGVRENRTGNQILHKTYAVDSGEYGKPIGQDYTNVLLRIRKTIVQDQIEAGEGNLRAAIHFRRGNRYDYTNNKWSAGIQYLTVEADPGYNAKGPRPRLGNVKSTFLFDGEIATLNSGGASAFDIAGGNVKRYSAKIYTVKPGSNIVRLKNRVDAAKIKVGRWHIVGSYDQQVGGFPPNMRYFDYVKVAAVSGDTVTLDRRIRHLHRDNFFEKPLNSNSMGVARIIPIDVGGAGGLAPRNDARLTIRETFKDIEFVKNPSTRNKSNVVMYIGGALDASFENCVMPRPVPGFVQHMRYFGGTMETSEPDKLIETLIYDGVTAGETVEGTGVELLLVRNSRTGPMKISPRQLRAINSTFDATTDTYLWYPIGWAYFGPILSAEFQGATFRINPTNADTRVMPGMGPASLTIGRDASWSGSRLIIPIDSRAFQNWEVWLFEGMIITAGRASPNWGVVRTLSSPPDGSATWVDIQWMAGTKPTQGTLYANRAHSLSLDAKSKLDGRSRWGRGSGGFMRQKVPPSFGPYSYDFPAGYPASDYGF